MAGGICLDCWTQLQLRIKHRCLAETRLDVLDAASLALGRGDEICLISDLPVHPAALAEQARCLSRLRRMRIYLVEDRVLTGPVVPGRYPSRGPDGVRRTPVVGSNSVSDDDADRRRELIEAGWDLVEAMDILPRGVAAA